jgi:hypothetical protein
MKSLARVGAEARIKELEAEITDLRKAFGIGSRRSGGTGTGNPGPQKRKRRKMSAAQRRPSGSE